MKKLQASYQGKASMDLHLVRDQFLMFSLLDNHGVPPLYTHLCKRIAEDRELLRVAAQTEPGQPPPNMLLGAAHFLLLSGYAHPLARYYASCSPNALVPDADTWPLFRGFCLENQDKLLEILAARRTQTNEVGRSALLLPAFAEAAVRFPKASWYMIEIGASAGINLNWDAYAYRYGPGNTIPEAFVTGVPLVLQSNNSAGSTLPQIDLPMLSRSMAMRSGIESHPINLHNAEDQLWLQALIFPNKTARMENLEKAIQIAQIRAPPVRQGDSLALLPDLITNTPADMIPLIFHSFVRYQFNESQKQKFDDVLRTAGQNRTIVHIALEWTGTANPTIERTIYSNGSPQHNHLATCQPHGEWLAWHPTATHP